MRIDWTPYSLDFRFEARTSRESLRKKQTYLVRATDGDRTAYGECALFRGLSADDVPQYEEHLSYWCAHPEKISECTMSSVRFGIETALRGLQSDSKNPDAWHAGKIRIPINGLIWMGDKVLMRQRIEAKLAEGFRVLKLKIGGIRFEDELDLLSGIRQRYSPSTLELRLDANGSFTYENAMRRLNGLARYSIHSIEQPLRAGLIDETRQLCTDSPIPIALDEELIGCTPENGMHELLTFIKPTYIILKPALCGGLSGASSWADAAQKNGVRYWFTSALESNIGLDAIATLATERGICMPQGLGTGELYHNNIAGPISRCGSEITYNPAIQWQIPTLSWHTADS